MEANIQLKEIILGSLLGDGCLVVPKRYKKPHFEFRHSILQKDYFDWKASLLKEISSEKSCRIQPPDGWSKLEKVHYRSLTHPSLIEIYQLTRPKGTFAITEKWLKCLTPISLMIWWLDDGSLIRNSRQGLFCTEGFSHKNISSLQKYLQQRWGIKTHIGIRGKYYQLRMYSTEELKKFLRLILPYFPVENMLPKVIMIYKDKTRQQRWISEIIELTGFNESVVQKYLALKKAKYAMFRK